MPLYPNFKADCSVAYLTRELLGMYSKDRVFEPPQGSHFFINLYYRLIQNYISQIT